MKVLTSPHPAIRKLTEFAKKSAQRHVGGDSSLSSDGIRDDGGRTMVEEGRREMVHEVGQGRRHRPIVLRRHEYEAIRRIDLFLETAIED